MFITACVLTTFLFVLAALTVFRGRKSSTPNAELIAEHLNSLSESKKL